MGGFIKRCEMIQCDLCGGKDIKFLFEKQFFGRLWNIYECSNCDVAFVDPEQLNEINLDNLYNSYYSEKSDELDLENPNKGAQYWIEQSKRINKFFPCGGRILDIGCNAGHFLFFLEGNWEKYGVELSEYAANIARKKNMQIFNGELKDAKYPSNYFDVITAFALIEHIRKPAELLREIKRILKINGGCLIMTVDRKSLKARFKKEGWHMYRPPFHLYLFSHNSLDNLMQNRGFEKIKSIYTDGGMTSCGNKYINYGIRLLLTTMQKIPHLNEIPIFDHIYSYYRLTTK